MTALFGLLGAVVAGIGLAMALVALDQRRVATSGAVDWLADGMTLPADLTAPTSGSLTHRLLRPLVERIGALLGGLAPSTRLDRLHKQVLHAGLTGTVRPEELFAVNVLTAAGSVALATAWVVLVEPPGRLAVAGSLVLVAAGVCALPAWLKRKEAARRESIFKDLPDALDLMVIGMEAGVTFDGAMQVVTDHLRTPLGEELTRTLAEMELGLSRRDALQNLKRRVDVPEVTNVVVSLLQADALGMSVSRVLRAQASEMRAKRRQWAREKAGKLPVKILFPLVVFIFPPVFVVILGPVAGDIYHLFG